MTSAVNPYVAVGITMREALWPNDGAASQTRIRIETHHRSMRSHT